jgi:lipopolysaccharide/colanic/teichoic acid biosynthesis glycosyltransferase
MIKRRIDTVGSGLVAGLVLPALTLLVIWIVKSDLGPVEFLKQFQQLGMLSKLLSLSAIPNLLLFFLFIWTGRNFAARGVIFATLLVACIMGILKLV